MFTGLVEETGTVRAVRHAGHSLHLTVGARRVLEDMHLGDSIAVNGVCLTVVHFDQEAFTADIMPETYNRTNLKGLSPGSSVNLERTMALGDRFGGHIVQGHVDGVGTIRALQREEIAVWVTVTAPPDVLQYLVAKGSVCVDGISLTVTDVGPDWFRVSLIPHTAAATTTRYLRPGDQVNLEVDVLAKYVERLLAHRLGTESGKGGVTESLLREHGFFL